MILLSGTLWLVSFGALLLFFQRRLGSGEMVKASVIESSEDFIEVRFTNVGLNYFFPVLKLEITQGEKVQYFSVGSQDSRKYRIMEDDIVEKGGKYQGYPWRNVKAGDVIYVFLSSRGKPSVTIKDWLTKEYLSETVMFLVLSVLTGLSAFAVTLFVASDLL